MHRLSFCVDYVLCCRHCRKGNSRTIVRLVHSIHMNKGLNFLPLNHGVARIPLDRLSYLCAHFVTNLIECCYVLTLSCITLLYEQNGTKAPQAAGRIHTDFEKGFIMAEVSGMPYMKEWLALVVGVWGIICSLIDVGDEIWWFQGTRVWGSCKGVKSGEGRVERVRVVWEQRKAERCELD